MKKEGWIDGCVEDCIDERQRAGDEPSLPKANTPPILYTQYSILSSVLANRPTVQRVNFISVWSTEPPSLRASSLPRYQLVS